jgi:hypothetical protein
VSKTDNPIAELRRTSRRSTRVPIQVRIEVHAQRIIFAGETVIVNLHGALIKTLEPLERRTHITLHVALTGKSAAAQVVFVDPEDAHTVGVELSRPQNIWGISLPPEDWESRRTDVGEHC